MKKKDSVATTATPTEVVEANSASATSANGANASADATVTINVVSGVSKSAAPAASTTAQSTSGEEDENCNGVAVADPAIAGERDTTMEEKKTRTPWWGYLLWAIIGIALIIIILLFFKGCDGTLTAASTDAEAKISALSVALAAKDAEIEALREQRSATQAPAGTSDEVLWLRGQNDRFMAVIEALTAKGISYNVDNSNNVNIDLSQYVDITTYNQLLSDCENFRIENGKLSLRVDELEGELSIWNGHVCPTGEGGVQIVYRDREVEKTVVDEAEVDRLNQVIASLKADIAWLTEQLAAAQEKEPQVVTKTETKTVTVRDTAEIDRLNAVIASLNARIADLESEISSHVCPSGDVVYIYVPDGSTGNTGAAHNPGPSSTGSTSAGSSSGVIVAESPDQPITGGPDGGPSHSPRG